MHMLCELMAVVRNMPLFHLFSLGITVVASIQSSECMEFQNGAVCLQSCIKPQHQEVKLELALDVHSANYDTSRGEQIACNADGAAGNKNEKKAEEKFFKKLVALILTSTFQLL
jgi:hypothetical protein